MPSLSRPLVRPPAPSLRLVRKSPGGQGPLAWSGRYALATMAVAAAFAVRQALTLRFGPGLPPYITLYPSVMAVAFLYGFGPGLWATAVAVLLAAYWILPPTGHFRVASAMDLLGLVLFIGMSLATGLAASLYHRYRDKLSAYEREAALAPTLADLNEAQRLTHIGSWHWDAATDLTSGSEELFRIFGHDAAPVPPLTFQEKKGTWYPMEDWERVNAAMQQTLATGVGYELDLRVIRGPSSIWVTARGEAARDQDGRVTGLRGTVQDINERKRAEEKVKETGEQAEMERSATVDLLSLVNESASAGDLITAVTGYFKKLSGCEAVGIRLRQGDDFPSFETQDFTAEFARFDPGHPFFTRDGSFWTNSTTELLRSTTTAERQACTRNRCNGEGYESVALLPLRSGSERIGLVQMNDQRKGLFTQEKIRLWERLAGHVAVALAKSQAEQELRNSEAALKDADRRKDEFLAVLSHELRNPLAAITNSVYLLEQMEPGSGPARSAQVVIGRQTMQLSRLVDDLLDVTRISSNKIQLQCEGLDLVQVARRALEDLRVAFDSEEVRFEFAAPGGSVWVWADEARVTQILGNLLFNAAKFTDPGGTVSLEIRTLDAQVEVRVADTGIGMDQAMLGRLFQPFAQADQSLDRSRGGLGLGLALAKGLAELHHGTLTATSPGLGQGSCFSLTLPRATGPATPSEAEGEAEGEEEAVQAPPPGHHRVLVIEDNLDAALTLKLLLAYAGHQVETAASGSEGIAKAKAWGPDVILCDIGLPDTDGYTVAVTLRAEPQFRGCRMVAMTGYGREEDKRRALEAGFDEHLTKPADPEEVCRLLAF